MRRRIPVRYVVAFVVACLIIGGGSAFVWQTRGLFKQRFEQWKDDLKAKKEAGGLPPEWEGIDLAKLEPSHLNMHLTVGEQIRLDIADLLSNLWYVWIPLVLVICLGAAVLLGRLRGSRV